MALQVSHLKNQEYFNTLINSILAALTRPYKCGPYEEVKHCKCKPNEFCPINCPPTCECIDGYARNRYGDCRKNYEESSLDSRKKSCGLNEEFVACGSFCEDTCEKKHTVCNQACRVGCACKAGFVRDSNGNCIPEEMCK